LLLSSALPADIINVLVKESRCHRIVTDRKDIREPHKSALSPADFSGDRTEFSTNSSTWLMTTSGTTGIPKIVIHTLGSLARTVVRPHTPASRIQWGFLYDPTRFAGMQVVLQALIGGGTLVAPTPTSSLADKIAFLAKHKVTHLSATPTLWRQILMFPKATDMVLRQITLGGEIVDQTVLNVLSEKFPTARLTHIYASTEAGVGFSVSDGLAGFPASFCDVGSAGTGIKIRDDILWLKRSDKDLTRPSPLPTDADGFMCTGDKTQQKGDRVFFLGRENGQINIGGVKVHPETIEHVIGQLPGVVLSRVSAISSPITGALVLAQVQLREGFEQKKMIDEIRAICRSSLPREAVPARIKFVESIELNAAGKITRRSNQKVGE
jgi:acyl-CoA synthetase (AMP-forming)/AMP-acid ligase II